MRCSKIDCCWLRPLLLAVCECFFVMHIAIWTRLIDWILFQSWQMNILLPMAGYCKRRGQWKYRWSSTKKMVNSCTNGKVETDEILLRRTNAHTIICKYTHKYCQCAFRWSSRHNPDSWLTMFHWPFARMNEVLKINLPISSVGHTQKHMHTSKAA